MRDYCDAQAGFWLNSKFWSKFSRIPLSGIEDQNTPPHFGKTADLGWPKFTPEYPPISENFRFGMTSLLRNTPPPFRKTSDLGWPKFTLEYPPISENFRFGITKVYSGIPPPFLKTSDLGWPKFTLEYPPNENCQRVQVRDFQNTESYYMWRLYPIQITTS